MGCAVREGYMVRPWLGAAGGAFGVGGGDVAYGCVAADAEEAHEVGFRRAEVR